MRGMVLASEEQRKFELRQARRKVAACVSGNVCDTLTYKGLLGDDVFCHLKGSEEMIDQ